MRTAVFEKDGVREVLLRYPGGSRGGWFRPNDDFLSTREANLQGWKFSKNQEANEN